jgi:hypothetical protein
MLNRLVCILYRLETIRFGRLFQCYQVRSCRRVRVAGQKEALDTLYDDDEAYVGCSFCLYEVSVKVDRKPVKPRFSDLAAV